MKIVNLKGDRMAFPTQWYGELETGEFIYVRFRHEWLSVEYEDENGNFLKNEDGSTVDDIFCKQFFGKYKNTEGEEVGFSTGSMTDKALEVILNDHGFELEWLNFGEFDKFKDC